VFDASTGTLGIALGSRGLNRRGDPRSQADITVPAQADDIARLVLPEKDDAWIDSTVRLRARQIAAGLAIQRPLSRTSSHRGSGKLASLPYRGRSDDIDLDRTIEVLAERPHPEDQDIIVHDRVETRRSIVLAVDVSGSMRGERIFTAAAAVGALAGQLHKDSLSVIAFWSDAAILLHMGSQVKPLELLEQMLRLPARGLTNLSFPLELAAQQLTQAPTRDARVILLSDCVHNAGPDPRILAARLPKLHVLIDVSGETDVDLGRSLAQTGHGTAHVIKTHRDVAPALNVAFTSRP
jgi:Mg-chelatase subunit ChlD